MTPSSTRNEGSEAPKYPTAEDDGRHRRRLKWVAFFTGAALFAVMRFFWGRAALDLGFWITAPIFVVVVNPLIYIVLRRMFNFRNTISAHAADRLVFLHKERNGGFISRAQVSGYRKMGSLYERLIFVLEVTKNIERARYICGVKITRTAIQYGLDLRVMDLTIDELIIARGLVSEYRAVFVDMEHHLERLHDQGERRGCAGVALLAAGAAILFTRLVV